MLNLYLQFFQCARFRLWHFLFSVCSQIKIILSKIWASWRQFEKSALIHRPEKCWSNHAFTLRAKWMVHFVWISSYWCYPSQIFWATEYYQASEGSTCIHVKDMDQYNSSCCHSTPHNIQIVKLHSPKRNFKIGFICSSVMAVVAIYETTNMEHCLITPNNIFKQFRQSSCQLNINFLYFILWQKSLA